MNLDEEAALLNYAGRNNAPRRRRRGWLHFAWIMPALMLAWGFTRHESYEHYLGYLCISAAVVLASTGVCVALLVATRARDIRALAGLVFVALWIAIPARPFIVIWWRTDDTWRPVPRELDPKTGQPLDQSGT